MDEAFATLSRRLQEARNRCRLTDSDLALWLGRPRQTVRVWRLGRHALSSADIGAEIDRRLALLNNVRAWQALPVPYAVTARERKSYLRALFDELDNDDARVPARDPSDLGSLLRDDNP